MAAIGAPRSQDYLQNSPCPPGGPNLARNHKSWGDVFRSCKNTLYEYCPRFNTESMTNPKHTLGAGLICASIASCAKAMHPIRLVSYYFFSKSIGLYAAELEAAPYRVLGRATRHLESCETIFKRASQALREVRTLLEKDPYDGNLLKLEGILNDLQNEEPLSEDEERESELLNDAAIVHLKRAEKKAAPPLMQRLQTEAILKVSAMVGYLDYVAKAAAIELLAGSVIGYSRIS